MKKNHVNVCGIQLYFVLLYSSLHQSYNLNKYKYEKTILHGLHGPFFVGVQWRMGSNRC